MEQGQHPEKLASWLNSEMLENTLRGKAESHSKPKEDPTPTPPPHEEENLALEFDLLDEDETNNIPIDLSWPGSLLNTQTLTSRLLRQNSRNQTAARETPKLSLAIGAPATEKLNQIFDLLKKDVLAARDRLLELNPGRRTLIERRLEYIARRIARQRGERFNRTLSLLEILKETFRDTTNQPQVPHKSLAFHAWDGFIGEVAFYHILQLFFLKSLDFHNWRNFAKGDIGRLNYATHSFLSARAQGFAHDKHCWNFVRSNVYSWHMASCKTLEKISEILESITLSWSDKDLFHWAASKPEGLGHLNFAEEQKASDLLAEFIHKQLGVNLISNFQGQPISKKVFTPTLELGGMVHSFLEQLLKQSSGAIMSSKNLQKAIWASEGEGLEVYWTEVLALLKTLRWSAADSKVQVDAFGEASFTPGNQNSVSRLPHVVHTVQLLGLELHNLEQLPLGGSEISKLQQGSAGKIQQFESFDLAVVTDHPDRSKSGRWMAALASQLPYWRSLVSSGTNLNWGELHLHLAISKLKEQGYCVYLSHRVLPEGGDGDRLRKYLLSHCTYEYFIELDENEYQHYRYLYVFRKVSDKSERDSFHPRFGKMKPGECVIDYSRLEDSSSSQHEIANRGWDHLFVRGTAPLVRHLNHKFEKLFQLATIQHWNSEEKTANSSDNGLFSNNKTVLPTNALAVHPEDNAVRFFVPSPGSEEQNKVKYFVFPHNPLDMAWLKCMLNSPPVQFWIRHQILTGNVKQPRLQELKSTPIVNLAHAPSERVHEDLSWLGSKKPEIDQLRKWACNRELSLIEAQARFVAMAKRFHELQKLIDRYEGMVECTKSVLQGEVPQLKPEAISQFYPEHLLKLLATSSEIKVKYTNREHCHATPNNWIVNEVSVVKARNNHSIILVETRQGAKVQILVPSAVQDYVCCQLKALVNHTWSETVELLKIPKDIPLFTAQTSEIIRVLSETSSEIRTYRKVLDEMSINLFEISNEMKEFVN